MQGLRVTFLFTDQYNTKNYGTITDVMAQLQMLHSCWLDQDDCSSHIILVWLLVLAPTMAYCSLFYISARPDKYNRITRRYESVEGRESLTQETSAGIDSLPSFSGIQMAGTFK